MLPTLFSDNLPVRDSQLDCYILSEISDRLKEDVDVIVSVPKF